MKKALLVLGVAATLVGSVGPHSPGARALQPRGAIAFFSDRAGVGDVYLLDPETARTRRITRGGAVSRGKLSSLTVLYNQPPVWAPDASALLFENTDGDRPVLNVVRVDGTGLRRLATDAFCASWSPDGALVAFTRSQANSADVWLALPDGTGARRLARGGMCPTWSPDGTMIAFTSRTAVEVMTATGAGRRRLARRGLAAGWSPDGATVLFVRRRDDEMDLRLVDVHSGDERLLVRDGFLPSWSPNGDYIAYVGARSLGPPPSSDVPDIAVVLPDGDEQRWLTRDSGLDLNPTWSPDGLQVAFSNDMGFTPEWRSGDEIFVASVDGSGRRRLTRNKAYDILPAWSPAR